MTFTQTITQTITTGRPEYLVDFICEISFGVDPKTGKLRTRPEIFRFPRETQPGTVLPVNGQFVTIVQRLNSKP
jgi:hypothetical protein